MDAKNSFNPTHTTDQLIEQAISSLSRPLQGEERGRLKQALLQAANKGGSLAAALPTNEQLREEIYAQGYYLFQAGSYEKALPLFQCAHWLNTSSPDYLFAIAACHHHLKQYAQAAAHYMQAGILDANNPFPRIHLHDCFLKQNLPSAALEPLEEAITIMEKDCKKYAKLLEKAKLEKQAIVQSLALS